MRTPSRSAGQDRARIRVILSPDGHAAVERLPLTRNPSLHHLTPHLLPGGLGRHKWADRRLATALGADAILLDADGQVLEATWANVILREGDRLVTPPADGRILPGVRRAQLHAEEEAFGWERLEAAEVLLTSALRVYSPSSSRYSRA